MKFFTLLVMAHVFSAHAKYIVELDQTRPIYMPVGEYNFEIKNKTLSPITVTLRNGEQDAGKAREPFVVKDKTVNLVLRAAGLDLNQQTILVITYTDKHNTLCKHAYQFLPDQKSETKKILVKWDGYTVLPQGGTMLSRTTSGLPLRGNIHSRGIKLMSKQNLQPDILT